MQKIRLVTSILPLALALGAVACKPGNSPPDAATPDGGPDGPTAPSDAATMITGTKPLAYGCSANAECASGFCVDGVCCDSACDQSCMACNITGAAGHCLGQLFGDDLEAAVSCSGAHTCGLDFSSPTLASCKLRDQQTCSTGSDCAGGNCATYFADLDRDGYGGANTLHLCDPSGAAPPPGYVSVAGDCCDSDASAYPGQTAYFSSADACGSFDYSCDGKVETFNGIAAPTSCGQLVHGSCSSCSMTVTCH